jgi:hypothetical protein
MLMNETDMPGSFFGEVSRRLMGGWLLLLCVIACHGARAAVAEPEPRDDGQFDVMNELSRRGLHDLKNEDWNAYGQITFINSWKSNFSAQYTNLHGSPNSLLPGQERSFTGSATFFLGLKLWRGGEVYAVPEIISERPLSDLKGLGSVIQNFELQKSGGQQPTTYLSRVYLTQTFGFGGDPVALTSDPMQLGATVDSRRLVLRVGNFSILDFLDKNSFSGDLRRQFNNMAFLSYAAYDFAADARGYTWGLVAEYIHDGWALRFGHTAAPENPNQLPIDTRIFKYFGHQFELERRHTLYGQPGAARLLAYRNHENMGRFDDAIAAYRSDPNKNATTCLGFNYGSDNATAPDLCWARRSNIKMGIGINLEQQVGDDVGLFVRGMWSDGNTEVYSYTSTDRSLSLGALVKGVRWGRLRDTVGIGYGQGWLSGQHVAYLGMGGIDGFIGDGAINYRPERVVNIFYSYNLFSSTWLSADYQYIENPGYNAARGPVDVYGARVHVQF